MVKNLIKNGRSILTRRQTTILSAAAIIMIMIAASRFLGLVRNRILAHFFSVETLSLYFAAFRLPEIIFEILVLGTLSSAFIPTFTGYLSKKKDQKEAWYLAAATINIAVLIFLFCAGLVLIFGPSLYGVIAAGFTAEQLDQVVSLSRILLLAQGFFVLSYFLTGVLESLQRFLAPALAPVFYNLGIILGTVFLSESLGIYGPVIGAVIGAFFHFAIQLPVAWYLGFRPQKVLDFVHPGIRKIGRLAAPRVVELSVLQVGKSVELFLASLITTASYTYLTFATSLQLLPIGLFGVSIAKASLPTLSYQASKRQLEKFKKTFLNSFNEILFLVIPSAIFLAVLRIPAVRLVFGASRFTWASTVETGRTLSAFCLGITAQSLIYLLARAFYALQDTKTPVKFSIIAIITNVILSSILVLVFKLPIWALAFSFSLVSTIQVLVLIFVLNRRVGGFDKNRLLIPFFQNSFFGLGRRGGNVFFA